MNLVKGLNVLTYSNRKSISIKRKAECLMNVQVRKEKIIKEEFT